MIEVGDARRCPSHPWVRISSPCGLFDGPCGLCEYDAEPAEPTGEAPPAPAPPVADDDDDDLPF